MRDTLEKMDELISCLFIHGNSCGSYLWEKSTGYESGGLESSHTDKWKSFRKETAKEKMWVAVL